MRFKLKKYHRRSKRGRGIPYVYQNRVYLGKKPNQVGRGAVSNSWSHIRNSRNHYRTLMRKKKVWYKKKIRRKKKKYKIQKGSGLLNGFKLPYFISSGKIVCNEVKKNYAMMKLNVPKRVTLPNGRTFVARYKRIPRDQLPPNIVMKRTYTQRAALRGRMCRRAQQGQGIFDFIKK